MGGAPYQAKILVDELVSTGNYDVFYLARRVNESFQPVGYEVVRIPGPEKVRPSRLFETTFSLLNVLKELAPDVIYQQVGNAYTGIAAYYAKHNDCKMIWRVSSDKSLEMPLPRLSRNVIYEGIDKVMMVYGIKNADAILVQTPLQGRMLLKNYKREADAVIRNFHPYPKEAIHKSRTKKILWIANLKKLKQPEIFVRLAKDLLDQSGVEFIMIGAPAISKWFSKLEEEIKLVDNLNFRGSLPQEDVNKLLAESHILVNTSLYEGFSNTFIQSWMREVPVITLNVNPDRIFDQHKIGFCADGEYSKLLYFTKRLINDPSLLSEAAQYSRQFAFEYHSLKNVDKIVEFLTI
jgi:glycosyltransferase involved in cell wall biosynthesis